MNKQLLFPVLLLTTLLMPMTASSQDKTRKFFRMTIPEIRGAISSATVGNHCLHDSGPSVSPVRCITQKCPQTKPHAAWHCLCPALGRRIEGGQYYTRLNPCEDIPLYKKMVNPNKWTTFEYFFSKDSDSPLRRLTKQNLKETFSGDATFSQKIDEIFRTNSQLRRFDPLYNMYLVNWVYTQSRERPE